MQKCMGVLATSLFSHVTRAAAAQPLLALELEQWLWDEIFRHDRNARHKYLGLAALQRLETDFLVAVLPAAGSNLQLFKPLIQLSINSSDTLNALKILEVYEYAKDLNLRKMLGKELTRRFDIEIEPSEVAQVALAIRAKLGASAPTTPLTARDRWQKLTALAEVARARSPASPADTRQLLEQTIEFAYLASLASAVAQQEPGFPLFDQLLESKQPTLDEPAEGADDVEKPAPRKTPRAALRIEAQRNR